MIFSCPLAMPNPWSGMAILKVHMTIDLGLLGINISCGIFTGEVAR